MSSQKSGIDRILSSQKSGIDRILLIDNYDSYTFNLYQYLIKATGKEAVVIRNDQFDWIQLKDILHHFDGIVISPGPGHPSVEKDFGVCHQVLLYSTIPILGVCLGHQGLASALGGNVTVANCPMHGRTSDIFHDGKGLFQAIPSPFQAVRYHSLIVSPTGLSKDLRVNAWCSPTAQDESESLIMGFEHTSRPIWTVQFHPESICTQFGEVLISNFCNLIAKHWENNERPNSSMPLPSHLMNISVVPRPLVDPSKPSRNNFKVLVKELNCNVDSEIAFSKIHAHDSSTFWLDSAKVEKGLSRYSYMGNISGPASFRLQYYLETRTITIYMQDGTSNMILLKEKQTFFQYLANIMHDSKSDSIDVMNNQHLEKDNLPPFLGGLVGYFGYEMKSETMNYSEKQKPFEIKSAETIPDSCFMFTDRTIIFDHLESKVFLAALVNLDSPSASQDGKMQRQWMDKAEAELLGCVNCQPNAIPMDTPVKKIPQVKLTHEKDEYINMIKDSISKISLGETYEVCLTTQLTAHLKPDHPHPFELYKHLRHRNPAPYAAYISFNEELFIASSSPERFLRVEKERKITMKPIKGTAKRATKLNFGIHSTEGDLEQENARLREELSSSEKNRSENLMIVDLIRNDLNQISALDSVHVPSLMVVESYATVHQLVSTVASTLRPELSPVDAIMRSFPPGSMTGAPKLRTVQIIEALEQIPRGPYSGCLGFFSITGQSDFNVIIRTAVFEKRKEETKVSVGAGGAIVFLSDPQDEFEEMVVKAHSVLPSLHCIYKDYLS